MGHCVLDWLGLFIPLGQQRGYKTGHFVHMSTSCLTRATLWGASKSLKPALLRHFNKMFFTVAHLRAKVSQGGLFRSLSVSRLSVHSP